MEEIQLNDPRLAGITTSTLAPGNRHVFHVAMLNVAAPIFGLPVSDFETLQRITNHTGKFFLREDDGRVFMVSSTNGKHHRGDQVG